MPKGKKAKKRIKKIFTKGSKARKQIKKALKDDKVSKKEMKKIRAAGATTKQLQKVRKRADKSKALKIGKKVNEKSEIKKLAKKNLMGSDYLPKLANNNPRSNNNSTTPPTNNNRGSNNNATDGVVNIRGSGGNTTTPANNNNSGGGNKGKGNKDKPSPSTTDTAPSLGDSNLGLRNKNLFDRGMKILSEKADTYQSTFGNKKELKKLRKSALERMSIDPSKYGREKGEKTLASRYDKNSDKLLDKLKSPLTNFLEKDSGSKLNMFKDGNIEFDKKKMKTFVDSDTDLVSELKSAAGALGYTAPKKPLERATAALGRIKTPYKKDETLKSKLYKKPKMVV